MSYDGAPFHGWQTQPGVTTVQQTVEDALSTLMRRPVAITGAGRTDTGVNAMTMMAHVDLSDSEAADTGRIARGLNSICGPAIAVRRLIRVADDAHARFDASWRTYRYFVHDEKSPFLKSYSLLMPGLDYEAMNEAAARLLTVSDFTSFAKLHADTKTNICRVDAARWIDIAPGRHAFEITADRFLRNMVRAVVGTLVEVGRGKLTADGFSDIVGRRDRCAAGTSMPGHALFLWDIGYPYISRV